MSIFSLPDFDAHEVLHAFHDPETRLKGFIAIHSTAMGPAFGGCRYWPYENENAAICDALRLSRGMSYKNALAELGFGGGKAVIIADRTNRRAALFEAFGRVVESLAGRYITAEDVGTTVDDMRSIARVTDYVNGIPKKTGYKGGDPSPNTALGVFEGICASAEIAFGNRSVADLTVAVQGVGNVGYHLCELLHNAGAKLIVSDIRPQNVQRAVRDFSAVPCEPNKILSACADLLAPCALGGVLNKKTIGSLRVKVIAGAANNQLATDTDAKLLHQRGILYAPDYLINAGGIISVAAERNETANARDVRARILRIGGRTASILKRAKDLERPPNEVAEKMARSIIQKAKSAAQKAAA